MKQLIIITILTLFSLSGFSQDKHEKIEALKTAYITEQLNLTSSEAEKFWPIYNTFEDQKNALKKEAHEVRNESNIENLTEAHAKAMLEEMKSLNNKRSEIYNKLITDLQKVISAKKIVLLKKAEDNFKRKMFEEYRKRHHQERKEKP
ncbi:Spy/CpxP family protein refolding chaperone [Formosa maritima]|uniref:Sensor of ECF-type sigma factor n=1 Tax=Formosa maritima TaxID=2592046 RepID=A0A5D0GA37_9FLAO|nr:Spy/CpxP family protein refolding chaperone [Formosa maritima]TYA55953.1 sensor of ECF-type sigma factor [Formosa maritima]